MNAVEPLPVPDVKEVDLAETLETLKRLEEAGKDETIPRSDELNAALAALPIMKQFVTKLSNWGGDIADLADIDNVLTKVERFSCISRMLLDDLTTYKCGS
jgi:hypothetical protein